jgi:hypothetical protein
MVSIQVQDRIAEALAERAKPSGISIEQLLSRFAGLDQSALNSPTGVQIEQMLREESLSEPTTASPIGTFCRADIYRAFPTGR